MISPTFKLIGLQGVINALERTDKQFQFGVAKSLTQIAKLTQTGVVKEEQSKLDRPTPYTLRSTFVKPATRDNLVAVVGIKDVSPSKTAASPADLLRQQFLGGERIRKNLENYLTRAGMLGSGEYIVPASGARLDQYGNISRGQVQQIMSQLRLGLDPYAWKSKSVRSKRSVKKAGRIFWSYGGPRDAHLARGAWIDLGGSVGVRPLLAVVRRPVYRPRISLDQIANRVVAQHWDRVFEKNLADALATAR